MSNSIILKRYQKIVVEHVAYEKILPGMLALLGSDNKVRKHNVAGGNVFALIPLENENEGKKKEGTYSAGDRIQCWIPQRGDEALLLLADGENVAIGDALESNGLGYVRKHTVENYGSADAQQANTVYSMPIVGIAMEAQDLSTLEGSNSSLADNSQYIWVRFV